jgi:Fic family protein
MSKVNIGLLMLKLDWKLISLISDINRFDAEWKSIERREGQSLKELKSIATIRSVGASTRIEGSRLSDEDVDTLLKNIDISKLQERDQQEVIGYFDVLDLINESYEDISITENGLKNLHNLLMRYSEKDQWHKGDYKQHTNAVQAQMPDGSSQVIFRTTEPGFATEDAMRAMVDWYAQDIDVNTLVKCSVFCYEFVTIHPFQDGNGRLSRLLATLLLRKAGYQWIQYVSLEHEIEHQKSEYYRVLRSCQAQRPGEDVTEWVIFFLNCLKNVQDSLLKKLEIHGTEQQLTRREKMMLTIIEANPGIRSGEIVAKLNLSAATVKRTLSKLLSSKLIEVEGNGAGTNYHIL